MFATRKTAAELDAELLELMDEAEELAAIFEGADARNMTDEERARFEKITSDGGLSDQKLAEVSEARQFERARDRNRAERLRLEQAGGDRSRQIAIGQPRSAAVSDQRVTGTVRPEVARLAGMWFTAAANVDGSDLAREGLRRSGFDELAAQTVGTPTSGGHAVPTPVAEEIVRIRDEVSVIPQLAWTFEMSSTTLKVPRELTTPQVYYPGEAGTITDSTATIDTYDLSVVKRAALVRASNEVLADAIQVFGAWITESMGYAMAYTLDNEAINGDGTATYGGETGLVSAVGSAGVETSGGSTLASLTMADWTNTVAKLPGKFHRNAAWVMSREVWNGSVLPLMAAAGGATFTALMTGASGERPNWLGYPVFFTELMPAAAVDTTVAMLGDFRRALLMGERNDMRFDSTDVEKFDQDLMSFRVLHRYDLLVAEPGDASNVGAYVALKLAAS